MAITFLKRISSMRKAKTLDGLSDVVTDVNVFISGEQDGVRSEMVTQRIFLPAPDAANFKPVADLTEEEVLSWVEGLFDFTPFIENITIQINEMLIPKEYVELPWASNNTNV